EGGDRARGGRPAAASDRGRADRQPRPGNGVGDHGPLRGHRGLGPVRAGGHPPRRARDPPESARGDARGRQVGARPAGWADGEDGVAGVVVTGRFPRRRLIQTVAANLVRLVFGSAARNWGRNIGSTAPALGSMTLLLLMSGLVGLTGFALHNLEVVQAREASLLHVYLRDDAADPDVVALWNRLSSDPRIARVTYVSKADALARAHTIPGLPELANASESNPFPASLDVQVKSLNDMGAIDAVVRNESVVDPLNPTSYDRGAYERIQAVLSGIAAGSQSFTQFAPGVTTTVAAIAAAIVIGTGLGLGSGSSLLSVRRHMES